MRGTNDRYSAYSALQQANSPRDVQRSPREVVSMIVDTRGADEGPDNTENTDGQAGAPKKVMDVVQFSSAIYIVNVDEGKLNSDIMRIGKMEGSLSFKFKCTESSAVAGKQFSPVTGTINMEAGQDSAAIEVPILNCGRWSPTTEFCIEIFEPRGCTLGRYLKVARVKVLDASVFPLNRFRDEIAAGDEGVHAINKFDLFGGFAYQMWQQDGIRWRSIVAILLDQLSNIYLYLRLWIGIYMVDKVFNMKELNTDDLLIPDNRMGTAYVVALLIVCPMFVLYTADMIKIRMDIHGRLQRDLSRNLFRKFMNFNKQSREEVPTPDMIVSLTQDCGAVTGGYLDCLRMVQLCGKLAISIFFTLSQNPGAWWACLLVPGLMIGWGKLRTQEYIHASQKKGDTESGLCAFVNEALNRIQLIADYQQRPQMNEMFAGKSEGLRQMQIPERFVVKNNMFFPHLLGPALIALYTAVGGSMVLEGELNLGIYLATISVFGEICSAFEELFHQVMNVIGVFAPLVGITIILNKATDVPAWKVVNRKRRALTKEYRAEAIQAARDARSNGANTPTAFVPASDKLEIKLIGNSFAHPGAPLMFKDVNFSAKQGSITAIVGDPGKGRKTLLELVAHKMFPDDGTLFIPSHLRILYVSSDCVLLNLSLWQNLIFGNSKGNDPFRVEKIMKALDMYEELELCKNDLNARKKEMGHGAEEEEEAHEEDEEEHDDHKTNPLDKLRGTQKAKIHLARALIMNPEVMVMHRPFMHFPNTGTDQTGQRIREILKEHIFNRGFQMDHADIGTRRPRTLLFTPDSHEETCIADQCWLLPQTVGGECVTEDPKKSGGRFTVRADSDKGGSARREPQLVSAAPQQPFQKIMTEDLGSPTKAGQSRAYAEAGSTLQQRLQEAMMQKRDGGQQASMMDHFEGDRQGASAGRQQQELMEQERLGRQQKEQVQQELERQEAEASKLKQELRSLGPRPMSSMNDSDRDPYSNTSSPLKPLPGTTSAPFAFRWEQTAGTSAWDQPGYNAGGSSSRMADPQIEAQIQRKLADQQMEDSRIMYQRQQDEGKNRRCCGP